MTQTDQPTAKTRTVTIFGGNSATDGSEAYVFARRLGALLAEAGFEVLNGGYDGTMKASSRSAKEAGGFTIGVTCPSMITDGRNPLKHNSYLDLVLPAPDMLARINIMMRLSGGFVVLDGGTGTLCELGIVWEHVNKSFIPPRPIVLAGRSWDGLLDLMSSYRESSVRHVHRAESPEQVVAILTEHAVRGTRIRNAGKHSFGFNDMTATVARLREIMDRFVARRDWQRFHDPKNLSASIAIEAAELMEHFQWLRSDQLDDLRDDEKKMAEIREELADVLAYVLSFAGTMGIDLASALAGKMERNESRYPADQYRGQFELS